jgi:ABC-type uncharacterized transport system involved in gliding motility auxiliary subunit
MKAGLLFLPFLAVLIGAIGTLAGSAFPEAHWLGAAAWAMAAGIVALWVSLDWDNFKLFFQRKGAKYGASSGAIVLLGIAVIVGVAVITSRPRFNKSVDVTRDRLNTLSDQSKKLIEQVKESGKPITLTAYVMDEQVKTQIKDLVALYQAEGANFNVDYVDPNVDPTKAMAAKIDGNTVVMTLGAQEKRLTTFNEEKFSNALVNVLKEKTKKIYFTKGHGEGGLKGTEPTGFSTIVAELEGNKDTVEELSLLETVKVPDDADVVVIAGPKYDFKEEETRVLEQYLQRGGALLAMVNAMTPVDTLNKLLEKFGVKYNNDLLILAPNDVRAQMLGQNNAIVTTFDDFNPVTKDFASQSQVALVMRFTRSIDAVNENPNKLKVNLVAKTAKEIIKVKNVTQASDLENLTEDRWEAGEWPVIAVANGKTQAPATAANDKKDGDTKSDTPAGTAESPQQKEIRLIAVGSVEFANNAGTQMAEHRDMFMNMTSYLMQDEDFISIRPKDPTKSTLDLSTPKANITLLLLAFVYPFLFLGGGTVSWLKRRRA